MCPHPTHTDFMAQSRNIIAAGSNLAAVYVYVPNVYKVCCVHTVMCMLQAAACLGRGRRPLAALDYGTRNGLTRQGDQLVAKYIQSQLLASHSQVKYDCVIFKVV